MHIAMKHMTLAQEPFLEGNCDLICTHLVLTSLCKGGNSGFDVVRGKPRQKGKNISPFVIT